MSAETKEIVFEGQCPFLKVKRGVDILVEKDGDRAVPVENRCEMEDDCNYWTGCPVFETCKKQELTW